jgi:hypothetical protein
MIVTCKPREIKGVCIVVAVFNSLITNVTRPLQRKTIAKINTCRSSTPLYSGSRHGNTFCLWDWRGKGLAVRNPESQFYYTQDSENCSNQSALASIASLRIFFIVCVNIPTIEILIALINVFLEPRQCGQYSDHVTGRMTRVSISGSEVINSYSKKFREKLRGAKVLLSNG